VTTKLNFIDDLDLDGISACGTPCREGIFRIRSSIGHEVRICLGRMAKLSIAEQLACCNRISKNSAVTLQSSVSSRPLRTICGATAGMAWFKKACFWVTVDCPQDGQLTVGAFGHLDP